MGKLFCLKFFLTGFLIFFVSGCRFESKINLDDNVNLISEEFSNQVFQEIYAQKDVLNLCQGDIDQSLSSNSSSVYQLKDDQYLVEILCFFGAYQGNYQYFFYTNKDSKSEIIPLSFQEFSENKSNDSKDSDLKVKNTFTIGGIPDFDETNKILTVYTKGRGLADCGSFAQYQWQDSQFALLEYRVKEECDGEYIPPESYPLVYP